MVTHGGGRAVGWLLGGAALGILAWGLIRLAALPEEHATHFHANFAIFVDGQRVDLSDRQYMEDVASCRTDAADVDPKDRVHLHNGIGDVAHVHDQAATWGHLLANLGFGVGDEYLVTDAGQRHFSTPERSLKFVLNGQPVSSIRNREIVSEDRLLISFGREPAAEVARAQFPVVPANAGEYNMRPDPAGCSGAHQPGLAERLRRAFWF